jgi:hypothetical protein
MTKRESNGGYTGGGTVVSPKDPSWFSKGSTKLRPEERSVRLPARGALEQAAYDAFRQQVEKPKYTLVKRNEGAKDGRRNAKSSLS